MMGWGANKGEPGLSDLDASPPNNASCGRRLTTLTYGKPENPVTPVPEQPKIYHITHVDNLPPIVKEGALVCDQIMMERGGAQQSIGMSEIKRRRVEELSVPCHPGTKVGDYVPFYFCPRSVMLYVIYCRNHPDLTYQEGQDPIVHLEADLYRVIEWAHEEGAHWAFSLSNAGARYAEFRATKKQLAELDWDAIVARDFSAPDVKERKQAEFLVHERFPFDLFERIGVRSQEIQQRALQAIEESAAQPRVVVQRKWYF